MTHPALPRSARHSTRDDAHAAAHAAADAAALNGTKPLQDDGVVDPSHPQHDPSAQNRVAPDAPPDGEYNQGGARQGGLDYQRDLGSEQDA